MLSAPPLAAGPGRKELTGVTGVLMPVLTLPSQVRASIAAVLGCSVLCCAVLSCE